jgi:beta-galactosidase
MVLLAVRRPEPAPATGEFTPPAELAAHWNWPRDCRALAVYAFPNAATVDLLLNGRSFGVKRPAEAPDRIIIWDDVPNEPATLKAVARGEGRIVVTDELKTAGKAVRLVLAPDHSLLLANGEDLSNIEVRAVDAGGLTVPDNQSRVSFQSEGPAAIAAIDNGDLSTAEACQGISQCELRNGRILVIIRLQRQPGLITLTARSEGLQDATISLEAQPGVRCPADASMMAVTGRLRLPLVIRSSQGGIRKDAS